MPFGDYESQAAGKAATVAAAHLIVNGRTPPPWLAATAADPGLSLRWPQLFVQLPGPERDRSDEWELSMGLTSKIQLLMARLDLTRDQAVDRLRQIDADNAELLAIGVEPGVPAKVAPTNAPLDEPIVEPASGE